MSPCNNSDTITRPWKPRCSYWLLVRMMKSP